MVIWAIQSCQMPPSSIWPRSQSLWLPPIGLCKRIQGQHLMCVQPFLGVLCVPPGTGGALLRFWHACCHGSVSNWKIQYPNVNEQLQGTQYVCECEYKYSCKMNFKKSKDIPNTWSKFCDFLRGHSLLQLLVKNVVIFVILSVCLWSIN